ncbi:MAG: hypothetical protein ACOWWO_15120 [Peptococcaceae bacterium]
MVLEGAKKAGTFLMMIFILTTVLSLPDIAWGEEGSPLAVLIILDRVNVEDIKDCPNIRKIISNGAMGLMNIRTAGRYDAGSGYLSIGAGTRASALSGGKKVYQWGETVEGEKAEILFENITGREPAPGNLVVLDMPVLIAENKKLDHEVTPGLLGEVLQKHHVKVTLLGAADTALGKNRAGALIAMNKLGLVQQGEVTGVDSRDVESPFLLKTDYIQIRELFKKYAPEKGLIVIQLGDPVRSDGYRQYLPPARGEAFRSNALADADDFIGEIFAELNLAEDLFMIITPFPSLNGYNQKDLLTPFIMAGKDIKAGLTVTPTTRRPGILTNMDVAPTILSFFDIEIPSAMLGQPVAGISRENSLEQLLKLNHQITSTYLHRAYLIKPFVALQIIISLGFLVLFFLRKQWLKYLKPLILAGMSIPLVLLFLGRFVSNSLTAQYLWLVVLTALLIFVFTRFRETLVIVSLLCLITGLCILSDLFFGAPLMKVSALGYDPIGGSRYYGLGNEYMGVLIGALIIGCTSLLDKVKADKKGVFPVALLFLAAFYLILSPSFGSNVGGTISGFGAFSITLLLALKIKPNSKHFLFLGCGLFLSLVVLFFLLSQFSPPSHISKTADLIKENGLFSLLAIFSRKLAMNYKLIRYTVWTRALLASIAVIAALLYRPPYLLRKIFQKNEYLYSGFIGTGVGCLLALICNDSGIVAAATMMIFIALPVMLLVIEEIGGASS